MAQNKAEIRIALDAREAEREAQRVAARDERRRRQAERRQARAGRGAAVAAGAAAPRRGAVGRLAAAAAAGRAAAGRVAGAVAAPLAAAALGAEVASTGLQVAAELVVRPLVRQALDEILPDVLPSREAILAQAEAAARNSVEQSADQIRRVLRLDELRAQLARLAVRQEVAAFARAGAALSGSEALRLSDQAAKEARRNLFLEREARKGVAQDTARALAEALRKGLGE